MKALEDSLEWLTQADGIFGKIIFYIGYDLLSRLPIDLFKIVN